MAFGIPPVIPTSIILNKHLYIYGSKTTESPDAQFLNKYDLGKGPINQLSPEREKNTINIEGYSPVFLPPIKPEGELGFLSYGRESNRIVSDIDPTKFLLAVDDNKVSPNLPKGEFDNFKLPELFPQQGYSVVKIDSDKGVTTYYFFGGIVYSPKLNRGVLSRTLWSYKVDSNRKGNWTNLDNYTTVGNENMPYIAYHSCAATDSDNIYCTGGISQPNKNSDSILHEQQDSRIPNSPNESLNTVYRYKILDKQWEKFIANPNPDCSNYSRIGHSVISAQSTNLYVIGGINQLGNEKPKFLPTCKYDTAGRSWTLVQFKANGTDVDLSTAFQTLQRVGEGFYIAGYGYRDKNSPLSPLIGININNNNYTLQDSIPISSNLGQNNDFYGFPSSSSSPIYIIIPVTVGVTAIVFGLMGFLLYRYKLRSNFNQKEFSTTNGSSNSLSTLFNSVPKHHRVTLWSDSITGNFILLSRSHYRHGNDGSQDMLIPFSESSDSNIEFQHLAHFQHQQTISRASIDLSPVVSINQLPQFAARLAPSPPSLTNFDYLTHSSTDLRTTSSSVTLEDQSQLQIQKDLTQTKFK